MNGKQLDVLEYIHRCSYVHGDLKGANILLGCGKGGAAQAYLVDFGLACHCTTAVTFKRNPKRKHYGTLLYTSRDAHNGVPTMRGDFEMLAYNLINWFGHKLPWELELTVPAKVQLLKETFMSRTANSLKKCFASSSSACPSAVTKFFRYIAEMKFSDVPDYGTCRQMFESALTKMKQANQGDLEFTKSIMGPPSSKKIKASTSCKRSVAAAASVKKSTIKMSSEIHEGVNKKEVKFKIFSWTQTRQNKYQKQENELLRQLRKKLCPKKHFLHLRRVI